MEKLEDENFPSTAGEEYALLKEGSESVEQLLTAEVYDNRVEQVELYEGFEDEFFDNGVPDYNFIEHAEMEMNQYLDNEYASEVGLVEAVQEELEEDLQL